MAPTKPRNHVTDLQQAFMAGPDVTDKLPVFSRESLDVLDELFPPRCLHRGESVDDHLRYAGKVELVEQLRNRHNEWAQVQADEQEVEDNVGQADKASTSQQ